MRFPEPLSDPLQSWILEFDRELGIKSSSASLPGAVFLSTDFQEGRLAVFSPSDFREAPRLLEYSWDWIEYHYSPLQDLAVTVLNWIPDPRVVCTSLQLVNKSSFQRQITLQLNCRIPRAGGRSSIGPRLYQGRWILAGECGDQSVVLYLNGDNLPIAAAASLSTELQIDPGEKCHLRWIFGSASGAGTAQDYLQRVLSLDWDGEIARRKIQKSSQLEITTGSPDRDWGLALSQKQAQLIMESLVRRANEGQRGQTRLSSLQAWLLCQALLPLSPGSLENLLELRFPEPECDQGAGGNHPHQPGPFPLDGELLWELHRAGLAAETWKRHLSRVEADLRMWFSREFDRDGDGIPEMQKGGLFEIRMGKPGRTAALSGLGIEGGREHPGLAGLLANELVRLEDLRGVINPDTLPGKWTGVRQTLADFIQGCWDPINFQFNSRDSITHLSNEQDLYAVDIGAGWNRIGVELPHPSRLILIIEAPSPGRIPGSGSIILCGIDWQGRSRVEEIIPTQISWNDGRGWAITESSYAYLDHCTATEFEKDDIIQIRTAPSCRQEISLLLPLWSPDFPRNVLEDFLLKTLDNPERYSSRYGLRSAPEPGARAVQLLWNVLTARALHRLGKNQLAADLAGRWLEALEINLLESGTSFPDWDDQTGLGWGKENGIESLFPVALYLRMQGVEFRTDCRLILEPYSALSRDIRLKFRGVEIILEGKKVTVLRPGNDPEILDRSGGLIIQFSRSSSENSSTW